MGCSIAGAKILQKMWEGPYWEGVWLCLDPWDVVRLRTSSSSWNVLGKYGPHSELFFFLIRKEPVALTQAVPFKPFVSVKSTSPVTENHYKNGYVNYNNYKNFIKTNEDNNHDTKYTNKNDTNNHDARDLHE